MSTIDGRLYQIDLIRLLSSIAIILIHLSDPVFKLLGKIDYHTWFVFMSINQVLRFGTPLFVMISGYLLLNSKSLDSPKTFYQKRLNKILIPLFFWNIFYYLLDLLSGGYPISIADFIQRFYDGGTFYHLYFLELILGLYLVTPLLKKLINAKIFLLLVPLLIIFSNLFLLGTTWLGWSQLNQLPTWFILYIGYYLAGIWVSRFNFRQSWLLIFITFVCFALSIFASRYFILNFGLNDQGTFLSQRLSFLTAIPSLVIFYLFFKLSLTRFTSTFLHSLSTLANLTLGVYLIHPLFIHLFLIIPLLKNLLLQDPFIWFCLVSVTTSTLSFILVRFLKSTPLFSRLV